MTEFELLPQSVLGLMPVSGIKRLLGDELPDPANVKGARAELYLLSEDPEAYCKRAIEAGARLISPLQKRDWGHTAAYFLDPDFNVIAFASL